MDRRTGGVMWNRLKQSMAWSFVRAIGAWWNAAVLNVLAVAQEVGKRVNPEWDGVIPSEALYLGGTALLMYGAYRAFRHVAQERDALRPEVDLTIEFENVPRRRSFQGANGCIIENVWIHDHTTPRHGQERGVLDFELVIAWQDQEWVFDKHPFQQLYRQADADIQRNHFQIPWQKQKNRGAHLVFVERSPMLIPDQAWLNFTLRVIDLDAERPFDIQEPGRHRLRWPNQEATSS